MRSLFTLMFGLAFAAVLCVVSSVSADVTIFQDDLETGSVGDELSARVPPVGWKYVAEPGEVVTDTATSGIGGNSGKFAECLYTDAAWITDANKVAATNNKVRYTMDVYVQAGPTDTTGMTLDLVDSGYGVNWWDGASVELNLTEKGKVRKLDTGAGWDIIGTYRTDTWVPVEVNADFAARTWTAEIDGASYNGVFDAANPTVHSFQYLWIGKSGYPENRYWDNLTITMASTEAFWTGIGGTTWSTAASLNNWKDSGGSAIDYVNGADVTFDDTATGLTADISAADVTPGSVLFNNSTKDFTVTGTQGIAGSTGLTKQGSGKVTLTSANSYTGLTTVEAGMLELGLNAQSPVLTGGGADIQDGEIVLNYTGGSTPAATVRTALTASYATGFASGQIFSSTATTAIGLGWADDTGASELTIARALYGDTNLDGSVDFADLSKLLAGYNQAGDWAQGDFDYTGAVAFADLSKMLANYNASLPGSINVGSYNLDGAAIQALSDAGITVVPEPSPLVLLTSLSVLMGLGIVGRRRLSGRGFLRRSLHGLVSKEVAMRRFLVLGMCILLASAAVANAEVVVTGTRSVYDGSLDKIDFHLTGLTGDEAGLAVNGLEGTWTALGDGATLYMSESGLGWKGYTALTASFVAPTPPMSYVNLNSIVSTAFARTGDGTAYSDFTGTWFTTEPLAYLTPVDPNLGDGLDQTLVGTMYVSTGAGASYVGEFSMSTGYPVAGGCELPPVPEPSTLALLACGLIGLLAYAWRKRK